MELQTVIHQFLLNPDKFDIERENAEKHLAFGIGRHTCVGKPVALDAVSRILYSDTSTFS